MFDSPVSTEGQSRLANIVTWSGILLIVVGGLLAGPYLTPYIRSRLYATAAQSQTPPLPLTPLPDSSTTPAPALLPDFESDSEGMAVAPTLTPTPIPPTPVLDPTAPPTPAPTPTPAGYPPTRVVVPAINLDAPIVSVGWETITVNGVEQSRWMVPAERAAGWHQGTAPLGIPGNTVLNGHNTTYGEVFRDLYMLEPGDQLIFYSGSTALSYEVEEKLFLPEAGQPLEVRQQNARYIQRTDDERVTIVTCHPYNSLRFRLVLIVRPVDWEWSGGEVGE